MGFSKQAFLAAVCIASTATAAFDIVVQSSGGNATDKFGHPFGYGFLHEVSQKHLRTGLLADSPNIGYQ
jgi:hypothetical protein